MKLYLPLLAMLLFLFACSNPPEVEAIKLHTQTVSEGTTIDNKFKVKSISLEKSITARDSVYLICDQAGLDTIGILDSLNARITDYRSQMDTLKSMSDSYLAELKKDGYDELYYYDMENLVKKTGELRVEYAGMIDDLQFVKNQIEYYIPKKDSVIALVYNCSYSFENVLLNNAKTERTAKFLLTPDKSKVIQELK